MRIEKNNKTKGVLMSYKSIVNVSKSGNSYSATDVSGNNVTGISTRTLRKAFKAGSSLGLIETKSGKSQWRLIKGVSEVEAVSVEPEVIESEVVEAYAYVYSMRKLYNETNGQKGCLGQ